MSAEPTARRPTWDCSGRERDIAYWIAGASVRQQAPLLLLHGFAGTHATWSATADRFGEQRRIIAPDLPGHGQSSCAHEDCTFESAATGLDAILDACSITAATVVGYSMGGRLALYYALTRPGRTAALILESASPGLESEAERSQRRDADERLAVLAEQDGLERFVDRWEKTPVIQPVRVLTDSARSAHRAMRMSGSAAGLAASLRGMGTGAMPWLGDSVAMIECPVLLITGAGDTKFTALARTMSAALPDARRATVADCGHHVHLEAPDEYATLLARFFAEIDAKVATKVETDVDAACADDQSSGRHQPRRM